MDNGKMKKRIKKSFVPPELLEERIAPTLSGGSDFSVSGSYTYSGPSGGSDTAPICVTLCSRIS